jgi:hypothetical protein
MPCMKDYGKTWDYEKGIYPGPFELIVTKGKLKTQEKKLFRFRKLANQYGVSGFKII